MSIAARFTRRRAVRRGLAATGVLVAAAVLSGAAYLWYELHASLPRLEGTLRVEGLAHPVAIGRDSLGIPTIEAADRADASFALGFLHAQERFFQMDLLRRSAAGELAALFGRAALSADRTVRVHRFRDVAQGVVAVMDSEARQQLDAYVRGVAAGLAALGAPPCEYLLLRTRPEVWRAEDTVLVLLAMFLDLGDPQGEHESVVGLIHDVLPDSLAAFLDVQGTSWDAPLDGSVLPQPTLPSDAVIDLRKTSNGETDENGMRRTEVWGSETGAPEQQGSNNWAVAGSRTANGRALLAGDMHLSLGVPNTWYRACIQYTAPGGARRVVTGITLPGTPAVVAGSNADVAWAFTNSEIDAADLVVLEPADARGETYRTPEGPRPIESITELIRMRGGSTDTLIVRTSRWGPVIDTDHARRMRVLHWTAHDPSFVNLSLLRMEAAASLEAALDLAPTCGIPPQNIVVAARDGRIGWTIAGIVPRRIGFDGRRPTSWADGTRRWEGRLAAGDVPRIVDPASGCIWTANARVVGGPALQRLGDGGYALGARAQQIRDALLGLQAARPADMLRIQLDDRGLFLQRWRDLLLTALGPAENATDPRRATMRRLVENWGGRAAVESAGYRIVRVFRGVLVDDVFLALAAPCRKADAGFVAGAVIQREEPVWRILQSRPKHLLDRRYSSWEACIQAAVDTTLGRLAPVTPRHGASVTAIDLEEAARALERRTWGERNTTRIQHPLSRAVPQLAARLDMPRHPLPGDVHMPRFQAPAAGASQRMVVSPGMESEGIFHMPCGESGHPLSPHYRDGHAAWETGAPTSFLPGATVHRLQLEPASRRGSH